MLDEATLPQGASPVDGDDKGPDLQHERVGRYVILERLGAGAMGSVHAAYDPQLDRKVAVKLLHPFRQDEGGREQLLREAKALARLSHPNVVGVHDAGIHHGRVFVAMEYVKGESLSSWFERLKPRDPACWRKVLPVLLQAGKGLAAAHGAGIVHRDFKAQNVLVGDDGRVQVADFGLALRPTDPSTIEPHREVVQGGRFGEAPLIGTPGYMAPELFEGECGDELSDQFAFCVTLYEGLYGQRPFTGATLASLACAVLEYRLQPLPESSNVPVWLRRAVLRGLSRDRLERWPSMNALLEALDHAPRRTFRRAAFAVASLALGLTGVYIGRSGAAEESCSGAVELAKVWDEERKARVTLALTQTGESYAADTARLVIDALDAYAGSWVEGHDNACRAYRRGERSEALLDLQMTCLNRRKQRLGALVEVFEHANDDIVENASAAVDRLPPLSTCADLEAVKAWVDPPVGPFAQEIDELTIELMRAEALGAAGNYEEARASLSAILERARELQYAPFMAEVLLSYGVVALRLEAGAESIHHLDAAWRTALASGHDEIATRALIVSVEAMRFYMDRFEEGSRRAQDAQAMLDRLENRGVPAAHQLQADLWLARGMLERKFKRYGESIRLKTLALERYEKLADPHPLRVADILVELGNARFVAGEHLDALEPYRRAIDFRLDLLGAQHPSVGSLHNNLGLLYKNLGRVDEAIPHLQRALEITGRKLPADHPSTVRCLRNLANSYRDADRLQEAEHTFRKLVAVIEGSTRGEYHGLMVEASYLHAVVLSDLGRVDEARTIRERALQAAEAFGDPTSMALAMWHEGVRCATEGDLDCQIEMHERALAFFDSGGDLQQGDSGDVHFSLSNALLQRGLAQDRKRANAIMNALHARTKNDGTPGAMQLETKIEDWLAAHQTP